MTWWVDSNPRRVWGAVMRLGVCCALAVAWLGSGVAVGQESSEGSEELRGALGQARALVEDNRLDEAVAIYAVLAEGRPDAGWLQLEIGSALARAGRFSEALPWLERAVTLDTLNLEAALQGALAYDAVGRPQEAVRLYRRVLILDADHERARFNLGRLQYEQGLLEAAEATWRDLIGRNPKHWQALNNLGLILIDRGQPSAALVLLRRAQRLKPGDPGVDHNVGRAWLAMGQHARALVWFDAALATLGGDDLASVRLHFDRGNAFFGLGRWAQAEDAYRRALSLDPAFAPARLNLGAALVNAGRTDEALEALELAVDYDAQRVAIYHQIALMSLEQDDPDGALRSLELARRLDDANARTFLLMGRAHLSRGHQEAGAEAMARACLLGASEACAPR